MSSRYSAFAGLPDDQLLAEVTRLAACERQATTELVASLVVLDERRLYLREGYPSLFAYCTGALHLSEGAAYLRIEAARAVRRFPMIFERLASGAITLTGVKLLAPHLTEDNHLAVLEAARGKSKREVEQLVARLQPRPDVPAVIRKLPVRHVACDPPAAASPLVPGRTSMLPAAASRFAPAMASALPAAASECSSVDPAPAVPGECAFASAVASTSTRAPAAVVVPLAPERYKVQMTIGPETHERLLRAKALLRHAVPDGDLAVIFDRALVLLLGQLERRKWGARKPRRNSSNSDPANRHAASEEARTKRGFSPKGDRAEPARASARVRPRRRRARHPGTPAAAADPGPVAQAAVADSVATELVPERVSTGDGHAVNVPPNEPSARPKPGKSTSRSIPAAVRRAVWLGANGQCTYVSPGGRRCRQTAGLEFHHRVPLADGGMSVASNVTLLCKSHHARESVRWFGDDWSGRARTGHAPPTAGGGS